MLSRRLTIIVLFITTLGAGQILTQGTKTPDITKGVFWSDADSGVEVYLVPKTGQSYRLTVISTKDVKVSYHTSINSTQPVTKELDPVATTAAVKYFEFEHYFSKMTIWMSLEFTVDGKQIPALSRAFYNSILEVAPGNMYLGQRTRSERLLSAAVSGKASSAWCWSRSAENKNTASWPAANCKLAPHIGSRDPLFKSASANKVRR